LGNGAEIKKQNKRMKFASAPIFFRVDQGAIFYFKHPKISDV
jgi:hypothetical protein